LADLSADSFQYHVIWLVRYTFNVSPETPYVDFIFS
jgi:hypothetical protein